MSKHIRFGEEVPAYDIRVLNEREVRAAAGILFLMMFIAILNVIYTGSFHLLKHAVVIFLVDILVRVLVSPRYSPFLVIGRLIVRRQTPEYVGAQQKKFAWIIGTVLAVTMFIHLVVLNFHSPITGLICLVCLVFLFFEAAFGICLGCLVYTLLYRKRAQLCPGEVCEKKDRQDIQRVSVSQALGVSLLILFLFLLLWYFNSAFTEAPAMILGYGE